MPSPKPPGPSREQVHRARVVSAATDGTTTSPVGEEADDSDDSLAPPVNRRLLPKVGTNAILELLGSGVFWAVIGTLAALAIPTVFYFGRLDNRVDNIHEGVTRLNEKLDGVREGINSQGARIGTLEHRVGSVEVRMDGLRESASRPRSAQDTAKKN